MATVTTELRYTKCPTCDSRVEGQTLARLGLTREELTILKNHRKDESFGKFLQLVDLTMKRMDPEKLATESEMKRIMGQLQKTIDSVEAKVGGTSIGKIGELVRIANLEVNCFQSPSLALTFFNSFGLVAICPDGKITIKPSFLRYSSADFRA